MRERTGGVCVCVCGCVCVRWLRRASVGVGHCNCTHVGAWARVCIWMDVCSYIGMHVCMYACMYVRLEILIFIYLWYARQAVVADNKLPRILNGLRSRILGTCKHASSSMRRWPDALCKCQAAGCDI